MMKILKYCRVCHKRTIHEGGLCQNIHDKKFVYPTEIK